MNRRQFLSVSTAVAGSVAAGISVPGFAKDSGEKLKVLVLGGRDYFGPTLINALLQAGHSVTHFNRGFTNPELFQHLQWIRGDREVRDGSGLINLKQHLKQHNYDLVVDSWQKHPMFVPPIAKLLKGHIGQYHYVSSISAYKDKNTVHIDEDYPLVDLSDSTIEDRRHTYGRAKAWSETVLFEELGDKVTTFRSHGMRSDRTPNRIYEPYWPARFLEGGTIVLPKDDNHVMQVCDVKSMIAFMLHCQHKGLSGPFNVARDTMAFSDYVQEVEKVTQTPHQKVWVPKDFLAEQGVEPYRHLPLWRPQLAGFYHININKAKQAGLVNRSVVDMVTDQLAGYLRRNPKQDFMFGGVGTISRQKERQILNAWKNATIA
ncbi:hypothetical protein [Planctobacterium marinum]|uniref:NAD-dependent epimerase/dehydratase domain-containing protein n=1 Tax=Planctobacterium marinum TaxID=1631968 RepID=A0AA48HJQ0_9ALTE|nr:hypothetical protein MACH26_03580 [Planctobacterium marinum]